MSARERPTQRQACNRCHNQKLRCIRGTLPNDSCQRCIKAREPCQSSPPLRQGRRANKPEVDNGPETDSTASSSQSTAGTDGPERQSEEEAPVSFPPLRFYGGGDISLPVQEDAHVFAAKSFVFPSIPEANGLQHESQTSLSTSNPEPSDFTLDDDHTHFVQDWTYSLDSPIINVADVCNSTRSSFRKDLSIDTFLAKQLPGAGPPAQLSAPKDAQGQLIELLGDLYADPYHSPMIFTTTDNSNSSLNLHLMDVTVKAAHTLLGVINCLQESKITAAAAPNPSPFSNDSDAAAGSFVDAETGFLMAACYSRIFRNANALAIDLHNAVSSNDISALRSMPSINIGSATPLYTISPVIQSALWAQFLWQSVRELEKRLLTLSHSAALNAGTSSEPMAALQPLRRSHMHELVKAVDADVAKLEVNVDQLLQTTLHTLRHESI